MTLYQKPESEKLLQSIELMDKLLKKQEKRFSEIKKETIAELKLYPYDTDHPVYRRLNDTIEFADNIREFYTVLVNDIKKLIKNVNQETRNIDR